MSDTSASVRSPVTDEERSLLEAILRANYPGFQSLRDQLDGLTVINREPPTSLLTLRFAVDPTVHSRYPEHDRCWIPSFGRDEHGQGLDILLWLDEGMLHELEIVGLSSQPVGSVDLTTLRNG